MSSTRWVAKGRRQKKYAERAELSSARHVIGRFTLDGDRVLLEAIAMQPGYWIDLAAPLTREFSCFYRWRTRQAAWQWLARHPDSRLQIVNTAALPGHD